MPPWLSSVGRNATSRPPARLAPSPGIETRLETMTKRDTDLAPCERHNSRPLREAQWRQFSDCSWLYKGAAIFCTTVLGASTTHALETVSPIFPTAFLIGSARPMTQRSW